jgi:hypothetical protein
MVKRQWWGWSLSAERGEGEQGEVRQRLGGASPFYRGPEGGGLRGFMAGVNASA